MPTRCTLLVALTLALPSLAFELRKDSQGEVVRWGGQVEFVIDQHLATQLGERGADAAVRAAVATLASASGDLVVGARVGASQGLGYRPGATDNQNDILALEDWPYDRRALAATVVTVNLRTHEIIDADIAFNTSDHEFRVVDALTPAEQRAAVLDDVQNTLTHELGHALGLMHNAEDEAVVMYPSALPLEVSKRVLALDDREGLSALYGPPPASLDAGVAGPEAIGAVTTGCAASGSTGGPAALLALMLLVLHHRRRGALVPAPASRARRATARTSWAAPVLLIPGLALAASPLDLERLAPDLAAASQVSVAQVTQVRTVRLPGSPGLLFSEVTLQVQHCLQGACPGSMSVRVPGGRDGDLEQIVAHQPVPGVSEPVLLVQEGRRPRLLRLEDRLQRDLAERSLARVGLRLPGSPPPQGSASPPALAPQVPATTR